MTSKKTKLTKYQLEQRWEKRKPIGDYWIEVGCERLDVCLHHKDGTTWSDPARAMSHLMKELEKRTSVFNLDLKTLTTCFCGKKMKKKSGEHVYFCPDHPKILVSIG